MVIHLASHPTHGPLDVCLNYRETCPGAYGPDTYEHDPDPDASTRGGKAVATPGTVAGLLHALAKYGTKSRSEVLAPAIEAAEAGFAADAHYVECVTLAMKWASNRPDRARATAFAYEPLLRRGQIRAGDLVRLPEQARALRLIAEHGADAFYKGEIAHAIVRAVEADGGRLTLDDLAGFTVLECEPLRASFMGKSFLMMPPPSSGGIVIAQVLGMLALRAELAGASHNSPEYIHVVAEAAKHGFADRARWLADPAFADIPLGTLLSPDYIGARAAKIDPSRTLPPGDYGTAPALPEDGGTSHLCAVDDRGNAVACTETINLEFGSMLPVPEFGFMLNDEMDDFLTRRGKANAFGLSQSERNMPQPGKRPLSSMSPTIAFDEHGVLLVAGASGGPRIISATIQASLNVLVFGMGADAALNAPRFHHQWMPETLELEPGLAATSGPLQTRGHATRERAQIAAAQLIRRARDGKGFEAASDPRKGGMPAGW